MENCEKCNNANDMLHKLTLSGSTRNLCKDCMILFLEFIAIFEEKKEENV